MLRQALSLRDLVVLALGAVLGTLLYSPAREVRASAADLGLACGEWVMEADQANMRGQYDTFILNVKTGELRRTKGGGDAVYVLQVKK